MTVGETSDHNTPASWVTRFDTNMQRVKRKVLVLITLMRAEDRKHNEQDAEQEREGERAAANLF
jgi:hypothetical protein